MPDNDSLTESSPAVHVHLGIIQAVIQRMAANSASAKAWCITLTSAVLVIVAEDNKPNYAWLALIPTTLFLALDTYYLALEKRFRDAHDAFVERLHKGVLQSSELYRVIPSGSMIGRFWGSLVSVAIWPFYLTLLLMIFLARILVL